MSTPLQRLTHELGTLGRTIFTTGMLLMLVVGSGFAVVKFFQNQKEWARSSSCQSTQRQLALGFAAYMQDCDGRFPPIAAHSVGYSTTAPYSVPYGWADALMPWTKSQTILWCPSETNFTWAISPDKPGFSDYWLNAHLDHLPRSRVSNSASTILLGDGDGQEGTARYAKTSLATNMNPVQGKYGLQSAWPLRHLGGANYAFADGHVKWLRPEEVSERKGEAYTFAP